jgi:hypothetical protein
MKPAWYASFLLLLPLWRPAIATLRVESGENISQKKNVSKGGRPVRLAGMAWR